MSLLQKGLCCVFDIRNNVRSLRLPSCSTRIRNFHAPNNSNSPLQSLTRGKSRRMISKPISAALPAPPPLDLTENNVKQVLEDARKELGQIFDSSVGITVVELADLDGPFVKISLKGRFWHKRSTVLARVANYLKQRIPEILEVDIEDEKQLDDSPENF
uniref:NIF system FeS cluster assembly NifU C-terminal domain-containing protein n=1 Tax=Glycine max TaxID=3847 RepID=I1NAT3_SOYBN